MGQNYYLNLLHNPTSYKEVYEWDYDVLSQEFKKFGMLQQMLNFIPTPCVMINKLLYESTKHDHLQDVIHMFIMHIHPMNTQRTCQHFDKVITWISREISNNHIVFLVIWKNIINLCIPKWKDINRGEIVHWVSKTLAFQLLAWCCVILKIEGCFIFLLPWVVGQQLAFVGRTMLWTFIVSTCELLGLHDWWCAPKSRGETHLRVSQSQVAESWDSEACSRLPTLERGRGSNWEPRD
jgi:hypothetical protein